MGMGGVGRWVQESKQRRRFGVCVVAGHMAFGRRRDAMAPMEADDDGSDDGHGAASSLVTEFMEKEMETAQVKQRRQGMEETGEADMGMREIRLYIMKLLCGVSSCYFLRCTRPFPIINLSQIHALCCCNPLPTA